jgi:hypothetical protein
MSRLQRSETRKGRAAGQSAPRTLNMEVLQCGFDVLTALTMKMIVLTHDAEEVHRYAHRTARCHASNVMYCLYVLSLSREDEYSNKNCRLLLALV